MKLQEYIESPFEFEEEVKKYFHRDDPLVIFDIGACEGEDSIKFKRTFPNATVYSFEPLLSNIKKLKANFKKFKVPADKVFEIALSDRSGKSSFHVSSGHPDNLPREKGWDYGNKSSSLLPPKEHKKIHKWVKFEKTIKVKTERLDAFCEAHSIEKIDFAYIDVQGAELMVLEGAGRFLKNISFVWLEVEAVELYKDQPLKNDVEKFMSRHGFTRLKDTVGGVAGDQLYVNKTLTSPGVSNFKRIFGRIKKNESNQIPIGDSMTMIIPDDMIWSFENGDYYERNVLYWLDNLAKRIKNPVFYDIGANYGFYSLKLSSVCKKVYAFEPVSSTYKVLQSNLRLNSLNNVIAKNIAIGSNNGITKINIYSSSGNNSTYDRSIPEGHPLKFIRKEKIKIKRLSDFIDESGSLFPSLIKVDVEGAEMDVLKGSRDIIHERMPVIVIEYSAATSNDAGYDRGEILEFLRDAGYVVYGLSSDANDLALYSPDTKDVDIDNLIAAPKTIKLK